MDDMTLYQKFYYRVNKRDDIKQQWLKLIRADEATQRKYVAEIVVLKASQMAPEMLHRHKSLEDVQTQRAEVTWMTFKKAADADGHQYIMECIRAGSILARKNKKLPEDTEIKYPFDQEVRYVEEKERIDKVRSDIRQVQEDDDAAESFSETPTRMQLDHDYDVVNGVGVLVTQENFCERS